MTQLVVKEGTLVYRWFAWSLEVIERFLVRSDDEPPTDYLKQGTNLCHMMRVLLIWVPLIFLIEAGCILGALYALIVWPIDLVGLGSFTFDLAIRLGVVGVIALIIWICTLPRVTVTEPMQQGIRLTALIGEMIMAKKRKICPFIIFDRKEQA